MAFVRAPNGLKLRSGPNASSGALVTMPFGAEVVTTGMPQHSDAQAPRGWTPVTFQGMAGFASEEWLFDTAPVQTPTGQSPLSDDFLRDGKAMSDRLHIQFPHLLLNMNTESSLRPDAGVNVPGHAVGLIQLEPKNLPGLGFRGTREQFGALRDFEQLPFIERFLAGVTQRFSGGQPLDSVRRLHQALFLPATLAGGSAPDRVLLRKDGAGFKGEEAKFYRDNLGFDPERKGFITVGDLEKVDLKAASPPNSPAQRALARLRDLFPGLIESAIAISVPLPFVLTSPTNRIIGLLVVTMGLGSAWWLYTHRRVWN